MKVMLKFSLAGLIVAKITKIFLKYQNLLRRTIYFKILINQVIPSPLFVFNKKLGL